MDAIARSLVAAQDKAEALFQQVVDSGMIRAGKLESELTQEIHALAQSRFGLRRHWHKRIARSGPNTCLLYTSPASAEFAARFSVALTPPSIVQVPVRC